MIANLRLEKRQTHTLYAFSASLLPPDGLSCGQKRSRKMAMCSPRSACGLGRGGNLPAATWARLHPAIPSQRAPRAGTSPHWPTTCPIAHLLTCISACISACMSVRLPVSLPACQSASLLVDLDGTVDHPHEPPRRQEADGARPEEEEERHHHHVAEVEQHRHEPPLVRVEVGSGLGFGLRLG